MAAEGSMLPQSIMPNKIRKIYQILVDYNRYW